MTARNVAGVGPAMEIQKRRELNQTPDDTTLDQFGELFERLTEALKQS
jgi:hypothetical protein